MFNFFRRKKQFFIDSVSPDKKWVSVFEDNGETGYLYLCTCNEYGEFETIVDALWIYNTIKPSIHECKEVFIIWLSNSDKTAIIVDDECWGIIDLSSKRKFNANRKDNTIIPIEKELWEKGLDESIGSSLKLD